MTSPNIITVGIPVEWKKVFFPVHSNFGLCGTTDAKGLLKSMVELVVDFTHFCIVETVAFSISGSYLLESLVHH